MKDHHFANMLLESKYKPKLPFDNIVTAIISVIILNLS